MKIGDRWIDAATRREMVFTIDGPKPVGGGEKVVSVYETGLRQGNGYVGSMGVLALAPPAPPALKVKL